MGHFPAGSSGPVIALNPKVISASYTASPGDLALVSNGNASRINVTLPASPEVGTQVGVFATTVQDFALEANSGQAILGWSTSAVAASSYLAPAGCGVTVTAISSTEWMVQNSYLDDFQNSANPSAPAGFTVISRLAMWNGLSLYASAATTHVGAYTTKVTDTIIRKVGGSAATWTLTSTGSSYSLGQVYFLSNTSEATVTLSPATSIDNALLLPGQWSIIWDSTGSGAWITLATNLSGPGLTAEAANFTATPGGRYLVTTGASAITADLPAVGSQREITFKKVDAGGGSIVITPASGTIDGASTLTLATLNEAATVQDDGTNWWVINQVAGSIL